MVDQVGTHTGTVGDDRQAERTKVPGRADPAAQQDRRAAVRAGSQDHAVGLDDLTTGELDPSRPAVHQHDPVDQSAGAQLEGGPGTSRPQVGQRGAHPRPVPHVAGQRADAQGAGAVVVGHRWVARSHGGVEEGPRPRFERVAGRPGDRYRAVPAVPLVAAAIRLDRPEERQQLGERPPVVAGGGPGVVVGRPAAHEERPVGRRAAADQPGPGERDRAPLPVGLGGEAPVVAERRLGRVGDVGRQVGLGRVVRARLDQQDAATRGAEAGGQHAAGRPGPYHDEVEGHRQPLLTTHSVPEAVLGRVDVIVTDLTHPAHRQRRRPTA